MIAILSLLIVLMVSMLIVRIGTVAMMMTGLSHEVARFQARSAFTGVGFSTDESEQVVNDPARRRIIMVLMLLGNAGIVTVISSLVLSFVHLGDMANMTGRVLALLVGVVLLYLLARNRWVSQKLSKPIKRGLARWTDLDLYDYARLVTVGGNYSVTEIGIKEDGWLAGRPLAELQLTREGVLVLGVTLSDTTYIGTPDGETVINPGDRLTVYGRTPSLRSLAEREAGPTGDEAHQQAMEAHRSRAGKLNAIHPQAG